MLKYIAIIFIITLSIFCAVVSVQPSEFTVMRNETIASKPAAVFSQINNLKNWENWSPWAKMDPDATSTFEGPEEGKGAVMYWEGNRDVGKGRMEITESRSDEFVQLQIDFKEPMEGTSMTEFTLKPDGKQTKVTWSMHGTNGFVGKAMGLIMNCEKMVGDQFVQGLASLNETVKAKK